MAERISPDDDEGQLSRARRQLRCYYQCVTLDDLERAKEKHESLQLEEDEELDDYFGFNEDL